MSEVQMYVLSVVAPVLVWALNLAVKLNKGAKLPPWVATSMVYLVAFGLALLWTPVKLPVFAACVDLGSCVVAAFAWFSDLVVALSPVVGFGTLVYNALKPLVLEKIEVARGWRSAG